jgi:hypothetical protein
MKRRPFPSTSNKSMSSGESATRTVCRKITSVFNVNDKLLSIFRRQDPADPLCLGDVKPGKALFGKVLLFRRLKLGGLIKRTDMKMRFRRPWESFASQS